MAKISEQARLDIQITFVVDENEARALDALAGYGEDAFVSAFYDKLGKSYMEPHETGLRQFLSSIRGVVNPALGKLDKAREALKQ